MDVLSCYSEDDPVYAHFKNNLNIVFDAADRTNTNYFN